ncbi:MAG: hydroxyacylglutathione hydrolase [Sphingobacteriales bacterium]|jgi:hydroxyacylglutathione hydrolase
MKVEQIYTKCLAQGSYYIQDGKDAIIIDPLRDVDQYIDLAKENGAQIKYIFETHFHADFVGGHQELASKTGAEIVFGPLANPLFSAIIAEDKETFTLGNSTLQVLHTPGHTLESSCFLLLDGEQNPQAIFTGDTLFLGDVGRPDLAQKGDMTSEDLAGLLYDSLRKSILPLPDSITVYPGHGAGSACGKNMMSETSDTLGNQKKMNYALDVNLSKADFVNQLIDGLPLPPGYFPDNVRLNKNGVDTLKIAHTIALEDFAWIRKNEEPLVLDVRSPEEFAEGHIPNSIFIGLDGGFAPWVGEILKDVKTSLLLITPAGREQETVTRLGRVGFDTIQGVLSGGFSAWKQAGFEISRVKSVDAMDFCANQEPKRVLDVRKPVEFDQMHIKFAENFPLSNGFDGVSNDPSTPLYVHCAGGYRSMISASLIQRNGLEVININGGMGQLKECPLPFVMEPSLV